MNTWKIKKADRDREYISLIVWCITLLTGSCFFLYAGYRFDKVLSSEPILMIGLAAFAIGNGIWLYYEITYRKSAERDSKEREQLLYSILQGSPIPTFVLGKDHRVVYWNRAFEVLSKIKAKDMIGTTNHWKAFYNTERPCMADLLVDETLDALPQWYFGTFGKSTLIDEAYEGTDYFPALGEKGTWLRFTAAAVRDSSGHLIGAVETLEDITEQKRTEEELIQVKKLESLGLLADGIAQDFGSLLSDIMRNIFLAKISVADEDKFMEQWLEIAEKASLQAKELTNRLITFSKGGNPIRKATPLSPLLRETATASIQDTALQCDFDLPDDLWEAEIDDIQIKQVIRNLMNNAREAMPPEGGIINIRARNILVSANDKRPLKEGKYVQWSIEDHGIGIPSEHMEKLFEPYFTTKQKSGTTGIGLGLALCYSIVKKHDGLITIQSELGVGTTVDVLLPAVTSAACFDGDSSDASASGKGKILVLDHDEVMRDAAGIMLNFLGYGSDLVRSGEEALRCYRTSCDKKQPYAAVILDATATDPQEAGRILEALKESNPQIKAIVAGENAGDPILSNFMAHGFSGTLIRPYRLDSLKAALENLFPA